MRQSRWTAALAQLLTLPSKHYTIRRQRDGALLKTARLLLAQRLMFTIFKEFAFSAAHAIRGHTGGCENLHGHNYRVRVHVSASRLDELGMVVDFADLKGVMHEVLDSFDHRVINEIEPFTERNTTAELFSHFVFEQVSVGLARRLRDELGDDPQRARVVRVEVWENDRSCAIYEP